MYFWNVNNKHCRRFFDVIMALLIKRNSKERNCIGWSGMLLLCMPRNSDPVLVCACALAQMLENLEIHNRFNCQLVSGVYCVIINSASL